MFRFSRKTKLFMTAMVLASSAISLPVYAQDVNVDFEVKEDEQAPPPYLNDLQYIEVGETPLGFEWDGVDMTFNIRKDAMRDAALSYGARGANARRTFEIHQELEHRGRYLDKVFDFSQLLIPAPSGLLIEPPIITESQNAMIIEGSGQEAAVSDRVYHIHMNARIVSSPRTWRGYLMRTWEKVEKPPHVLLPQNAEERKFWIEQVSKGWELGYEQANEIFEADLNNLVADYEGMVRYRLLLSQGMVSAPYALQVDRGITGGGNEMRVGDRAVQITGVPELITGSEGWQPASR